MSSGPITPPLPVNATISIQPLPTAIPSGVASDVPSILATLAGGSTVQGFVINRDGQNNPVLRTNLGDVLVRSDVFIKTGSDVVIRVDTTLPGRARIVSIDGLPPEDYVTQNVRTSTGDSITNTALPTGATRATSAASTNPSAPLLEALVLKSAPALPLLADETVPARLVGLKPGQPLRVQVLNAQLPAAAVSLASIAEPTSLLEQLLPAPAAASGAVRTTESAASPAVITPPVIADDPFLLSITPKAATIATPQAGTQSPPYAPLPPPALPPIPTSSLSAPTATPQAETPRAPLPFTPEVSAVRLPASASLIAQEIANTPPVTTPHPAVYPNITPAAASLAAPRTLPSTASLPPVSLELGSVPLTSAAANNNAAIPPSEALRAVVIGHEADGAAILHSPVATLKLYTPQPIPQGTELTLQVIPGEAPRLTPLPTSPSADDLLRHLGRELQDTLTGILQQPAIAATPQVLANLPAPGAHFASTILFFLAAVSGGNPSELLGSRGIEKLRSFTPELLAKLAGELEQLQPFLAPPAAAPWSSIPVPILVQGQIELARFYFKRDDESSGGGAKSGSPGQGQRFVVDVELTQLGPMQFDGFVRPAPAQSKKQLDLIIRSSQALPPEVVNGIRERFTTTLAITGLTGQTLFQQGSQHFIRPHLLSASHQDLPETHKPILA